MDKMRNSDHKENREHVRAPISVPVRFTVISPDEYNNVKAYRNQNSLHGLPGNDRIGPSSTEKEPFCTKCDTHLIDFLFRIDDKLDRILELMLRNEKDRENIRKGRALNISGTGMNIVHEEPLPIGYILNTNFLVSKFPPVWLDLYGTIIRVTPIPEGKKTNHEIALKFIDLNEEDREKIIFYTFQQQRGAIRSMKGTDE